MVAVHSTKDPTRVLDRAGRFLASDPIRHNLILSLLHSRVAHPEAGRYWMVDIDGDIVGVALQSPVPFFATVTPMPTDGVRALVDDMVDNGIELPGVTGEAATAASFAGHWTERTRSAGHPEQGQRLYEVGDVVSPRPTRGEARVAAARETDLLVAWLGAFQAEAAEPGVDARAYVDRRLRDGQFHVWYAGDQTAAAMAAISDPVGGAVRIGPVYTPPEHRRHGYASALVAQLSRAGRSGGNRCLLYTDLANPTSNAIYRAIGYRPVTEILRYRFA